MDNDAIERLDSQKTYSLPISIITLGVVALLVLNLLFDTLNEHMNLNPGVRGLGNLFIPAAVSILCGIFLVLFRWGGKRTWIGLLLIAAPFLLFALIQPVVDGDGSVVRAQFRFQKQLRDFRSAPAKNISIDLETTNRYDFPRFLGPNANGTVDAVKLDDWKLTQPGFLWKQPIGDGWSGFSAVNNSAITQEQRGEDECVTCYDIETGAVLWINSAKRRHEDITGVGKPGPRATPTIHEGKVYVMSATGVLDCLDGEDGSLLWSADVPKLVGIGQKYSTNSTGEVYSEETSTLAWGRASSPLIYKDLVIVPGGRSRTTDENYEANKSKAATLLAFNKQTGKIVWRGGERMIAYGSPTIATLHGADQVVLIAEDHAVGHDPETGKELWAFEREGHSNTDANCSQVTQISDTQLLFSKGYSKGGELVDILLDGPTGKYSVKSLFSDPRILKTKLTSPVIYQDHLYSLSDGYLECVAIENQKLERKWKQRGRFGNGQLLLVGDKLLVHSEHGTLHLVQPDPTAYQELGKLKTIKGVCWNTLCLYKDLLLIRSELEATCIRLPIGSK